MEQPILAAIVGDSGAELGGEPPSPFDAQANRLHGNVGDRLAVGIFHLSMNHRQRCQADARVARPRACGIVVIFQAFHVSGVLKSLPHRAKVRARSGTVAKGKPPRHIGEPAIRYRLAGHASGRQGGVILQDHQCAGHRLSVGRIDHVPGEFGLRAKHTAETKRQNDPQITHTSHSSHTSHHYHRHRRHTVTSSSHRLP